MLRLDLTKKNEVEGIDGLPVMKITLNETTLDEIRSNSKEIKYEGNSIEFTVDERTEYFSDVQIKGRGNSTWGGNKRPFQIKFDKKVDLLGLGARKKYVLLANAVDNSFVRNAMMVKMSGMIGEQYRILGEPIQLYIDNDYQGLYYLTTKAEIGKNAVDLRDRLGVLMELDSLHQGPDDCKITGFGECLIVKDAVFEGDEEVLKEATDDFLASFNKLEVAAKRGNFKKLSEVADVHSFAEYFLISEYAVNPDAFVSSFNLYKDGKDDKIHAGPLWDYDYAFGNRNWIWASNEDYFSPTETMVRKKEVTTGDRDNNEMTKLFYYLMDIPEFRAEVERIYQDKISGRKTELLMTVLSEAAKVREAAEKDSERWGKDKKIFYREVKYLLDWLNKRYDYFEEEYGKKEWDFKSGVI